MASYELWLTDDKGVRLAQLTTFVRLEASRLANKIGSFSLTMPLSFDRNLLRPDRMVQVWRQPTGGQLGLWRVYFVRRWRFETRGSDNIVTFSGPDTNDLLRRRIVAAYSGTGQSDKTDFADDMMKEVVSQSILDNAAPTPDAGTRVWSDLSVTADTSSAPTITKGFGWDKLLTTSGQGVLPSLAKAAREDGTDVYFDITPNVVGSSSMTFKFQTFIGQPGQDVSDRVVFDQSAGNLANPFLEEDYTEEENYIYSGGQGQGEDRNIQQVFDSGRYSVSQWNRCEGFADARNQTTNDGVRESGRDRLNEGRPRIRFGGIPIDTKATRFGIDWDFGYKVTAKYQNREFLPIIKAVTLTVDSNGRETVETRLDYEE